MKRSSKLLLLLFLCSLMESPSTAITKRYSKGGQYIILDTTLLKVNYLKTFKEFTEDRVMKKNIYELKIGEEVSSFEPNVVGYLSNHLPEELLQDINKENERTVRTRYAIKEWHRYYCTEKIPTQYYKNHPEAGMMTVMAGFGDTNLMCYYKDSIPSFDWQLEEGDSIVCGYPCSKATTSFRGRTWYVWYTLDIPISEGPWKLCGLPGLILKATDSKGDFDITAIAIEKTLLNKNLENKIFYFDIPRERITPQRLVKLGKQFFEDEIAFLRWRYGEQNANQIIDMKAQTGTSVTAERKIPCLIEYYE